MLHEISRRTGSAIKVQLSRFAGSLIGSKQELTLGFEKDEWGFWLAVIPSWPGPKAALAMVDGADVFLDQLSNNSNFVELKLSTQPKPNWEELVYSERQVFGDGAYYIDQTTNHRMWLCGVTEFIFAEMPERIWFRVGGIID